MSTSATESGQAALVAVDIDAIARTETGRRIRALREARGLTQAALAKAAGASQSEVSRAESKPGAVRLATLIKLAEALGSSLFEFSGQKPVVLRARDLAHMPVGALAEIAAVPGVQLVN